MRALLLGVALVSSAAWAQAGMGVDGLGRIAIGGGYRWLPNWWFQEKLAAAGYTYVPSLDGGVGGVASFGLGVSRYLELTVDVPVGYHAFAFDGPDGTREAFTSLSIGAFLGPRVVATDVLFKGLMPWAAAEVGGVLTNVGGRRQETPERLVFAFSVAGGLTWRFLDRYGITLEARYVNARNAVTDISGINAGGVWFSAMFTMFFPPPLKRDLDVPGF